MLEVGRERESGEGSVCGGSLRDVAKSWVLGVGRGRGDGSVWGGYWEQGEALAVWLLALAENLTERMTAQTAGCKVRQVVVILSCENYRLSEVE